VVIAASYLKKAVEELVDNAFKFSRKGTPVRITGAVANDLFHLTISDRGRGMTPQQIADVGAHMQFERRFYEQQGVGLGLTIAKRLIELHGGDFTIDSTQGQQTVVHVTLPMSTG